MRATVRMVYAGDTGTAHVITAELAVDDWLLFRSGSPGSPNTLWRGALPPTGAGRDRVARWSPSLSGQPDRVAIVPRPTSTNHVPLATGASPARVRERTPSDLLAAALCVPDDLLSPLEFFFGGQGASWALPLALPIAEWDSGIPIDLLDYFAALPTHLVLWGSGAAYCTIPASEAAAQDYHPAMIAHDMAMTDLPVGVPREDYRRQIAYRLSGASGNYVGSADGDAILPQDSGIIISQVQNCGATWPGNAHLYHRIAGAGPTRLGWLADSGGGALYAEGAAVRSTLALRYGLLASPGGPDNPTGPITGAVRYIDLHGATVGTQAFSLPLTEIDPYIEWEAEGEIALDPPASAWIYLAEFDPGQAPTGFIGSGTRMGAQGRIPPLPWLCHDADGALVGPGYLRDVSA